MNKHMQKYPPRPEFDDEIRAKAAEQWANDYISYYDDEIKEELQELLVKHASAYDDGFELGKMVDFYQPKHGETMNPQLTELRRLRTLAQAHGLARIAALIARLIAEQEKRHAH